MKFGKIAVFSAQLIVTVSLFIGILFTLAMIADASAMRSQYRDHCWRHATNGYEIDKCKR